MAEVAKDMAKRKGSGSARELYEFIKKVRLARVWIGPGGCRPA